jgi:SAM-dependent methyltransferase
MGGDADGFVSRMDSDGFFVRYRKLAGIIAGWVRPRLELRGSRVMDFGCGEGITALGIAREYGAREVVGVDIMPDPGACSVVAREHLALEELPRNLRLHRVRAGELAGEPGYDLVYAWSVFEHVDQRILAETFSSLRGVLRPGGFLLIQVDPLYYSAFGSHLYEKVPIAWGHLTMQGDVYEERLAAVCGSLEEFHSLISTYRTLNKITSDDLVFGVKSVGFRVLRTLTTRDGGEPPADLRRIYNRAVLETNQVVILAQAA